MTGNDLKRLRRQLRLSTREIGEIAGVSPRTVENWEQGSGIPRPCQMLIERFLSEVPQDVKDFLRKVGKK